MSLKPWREIARPHKDVLEGSLQQSEFAADISRVKSGDAAADYQDAEKFFARTYITEGMRLLLISVARRLVGQGGDPVIQLQTAFGGGKTHTMLAVYHLASRRVSTQQLQGVPPVLDDAGISELPKANVAVIDGIKLSPSQPQQHCDLSVNTLWGELAYQLLGEEGYAMVANSDADGTSPGKEVLRQLIDKASPCVILVDELVAFFRQLEADRRYAAGTFDANITFIQALTEALKATPNAIMLASLPESEAEVGGTMGQRSLESLQKYFARLESVWKPVASNEAFEIVRRRLFESAGNRTEIEAVCRQFADFYRNSHEFPMETQKNEYYERLCQSYPIHPEVFDRLYEDWSTLDKFQRTRGVLQYMAIVIHHLWQSDNRDALIMPGSISLDDSEVRNKSIHYLPPGWDSVIEKEVDGPKSEPFDIDSRDTRLGGVQASRRTMRTIFLGSAPASDQQSVRGLDIEHILLGCVSPSQSTATYRDALKRLRDRLHYLYSDQDKYFLGTRPNLRREMESRKQNIDDFHELMPLLKQQLGKIFGNQHCFSGIHVFTESADIPDDYGNGPRLIVLPTTATYSPNDTSSCYEKAESILRFRGEQPRQKQNRLIFLAAHYDSVIRLKDIGRTYLAWQSIIKDIDDGKLDLQVSLVTQSKDEASESLKNLQQLLLESYRWLICPYEEIRKGKSELTWETASVSSSSPNLIKEIEQRLKEEEWLISQWSPIHLRQMLSDYYFKHGTADISAQKVWQDSCCYLYLPRLVNDTVFRNTINDGLQSKDYFAYADAKEGNKYIGFRFGKGSASFIDDNSLLIEHTSAEDYQEIIKQTQTAVSPDLTVEVPTQNPHNTQNSSQPITASDQANAVNGIDTAQTPSQAVLRRFYATKELNHLQAKLEFKDIIDEVIQQFSEKINTDVSISIEIHAQNKDGFDEALQRSVKENCNQLGFTIAEFED